MSEPVARLIHRSGAARGHVHELGVGRYVLGRTRQADIVLDHDDVSRLQAELIVHGEGAELLDLGSKNGSMVDGRRAVQHALCHGAKLQFGELVLELDHPGARVDRILASSGEPTASRASRAAMQARARKSLAVPLIMALVFASLLVLLLIYG